MCKDVPIGTMENDSLCESDGNFVGDASYGILFSNWRLIFL